MRFVCNVYTSDRRHSLKIAKSLEQGSASRQRYYYYATRKDIIPVPEYRRILDKNQSPTTRKLRLSRERLLKQPKPPTALWVYSPGALWTVHDDTFDPTMFQDDDEDDDWNWQPGVICVSDNDDSESVEEAEEAEEVEEKLPLPPPQRATVYPKSSGRKEVIENNKPKGIWKFSPGKKIIAKPREVMMWYFGQEEQMLADSSEEEDELLTKPTGLWGYGTNDIFSLCTRTRAMQDSHFLFPS